MVAYRALLRLTVAVPKAVMITPTTAAAAALNPYVTSIGTGGFTIGVQTAPAGSQANTVYGFSWQVVG